MFTTPHFIIDGLVLPVSGWQFNDTEGGYDQCSGVIPETSYRRAGAPSQGATVKIYDDTGLLWSGRMAQPPTITQGRCSFNAVGLKEKAAKKTDRLLIQSADLSQWVQYDSDPHLNGSDIPVYGRSRKINLDATNTGLRFSIDRNQTLNTGDDAVFIFYAEGVDLGGGRLKWTQTYNAADEFAKLDFRVQRADGPTGSETNVTTVLLNTGNNGSQQNITIGGGSTNDLVTLGLHCNDGTFTPNADNMRWMATKVRVNSSITSGDSYNAYEVVDYIADQLSWDTTGIVSSTFDVLPFDWIDGTYLDAMLYVAELEDKAVRVGDGTVEYDAWGMRDWTVYQADGARVDLKPLELYNQARVTYETATGVQRKKTRTTSDVSLDDPLAAAGITNTYEYPLEDRQKNSTLAQNVADKLVTRFSQQRYAGSIEIAAARADDENTNPRNIRYGDTITVGDWAIGESLTCRVVEVSQTPTSITVGVEQPVNIAALISHTSSRRRHRPHRQRTIAGSYVGGPF